MSKNAMFADPLVEREKRRFGTILSKNALKAEENIKKPGYFSQKVTFRA
ncbi:MAG: hypothetical protein IJT68_00605 [Lentisphaeria bacterium]|nr:hypothetical protein [Lentisphaeria bacterium]